MTEPVISSRAVFLRAHLDSLTLTETWPWKKQKQKNIGLLQARQGTGFRECMSYMCKNRGNPEQDTFPEVSTNLCKGHPYKTPSQPCLPSGPRRVYSGREAVGLRGLADPGSQNLHPNGSSFCCNKQMRHPLRPHFFGLVSGAKAKKQFAGFRFLFSEKHANPLQAQSGYHVQQIPTTNKFKGNCSNRSKVRFGFTQPSHRKQKVATRPVQVGENRWHASPTSV